jgi:hypothetical protein
MRDGIVVVSRSSYCAIESKQFLHGLPYLRSQLVRPPSLTLDVPLRTCYDLHPLVEIVI